MGRRARLTGRSRWKPSAIILTRAVGSRSSIFSLRVSPLLCSHGSSQGQGPVGRACTKMIASRNELSRSLAFFCALSRHFGVIAFQRQRSRAQPSLRFVLPRPTPPLLPFHAPDPPSRWPRSASYGTRSTRTSRVRSTRTSLLRSSRRCPTALSVQSRSLVFLQSISETNRE